MKPHSDKFILTLQSLARSGRHWDVCISRQELADDSFDVLADSVALLGDMTWKGSLIVAESGFVLAGVWQMAVPRQCGRCNVSFALDMQGEVKLDLALGDAEKHAASEGQDDNAPDVEVLSPPGQLNVLDVLREHFWLAWQPMTVCSATCKGLCQQCGLNLNDGQCDCHNKREDHPFAALQGLKFDA